MTTTPPSLADIYAAQFSTGDLAKAAKVTSAALQTWIRRELIVGTGQGVDMPGQPGIRRAFSFRNLIEVAMGAALIERGIPPRDAFKASAKFAHTGANGRQIALPFATGITLLCVDGERSNVVHIGDGGTVEEMMQELAGAAEGFFILLANGVFDRVMSAIGWHPEAVLEAAYASGGGGK